MKAIWLSRDEAIKILPEKFIEKDENHFASLSISFWLMYDNFTFKELKGNDLEEIIQQALYYRQPYSMLCSPNFTIDGIETKKTSTNVHFDEDDIPFMELLDWKEELLRIPEIHLYFDKLML